MLKISKLSDYAIVVLSRLAVERGEVLTTSNLSSETGIPEPTVSKVLKLLSKQKIVISVRGANGGYRLERAPTHITVTELITALEGPIALTTCLDEEKNDCMIDALCPLKGGWGKVNRAVKSALDEVALSDLLIPITTARRG
jgi:FeS assembly SUF system regulator